MMNGNKALHAVINLIITFLVLGPSNSQKKIDCHVPKTRQPFMVFWF